MEEDSQDEEWVLLPEHHQRTIVHIDVDCFYAQVEMVRNPDLKGKPVGIKQKNIMITCNYEARSLGVQKSMFVSEAKKLLPVLILVDGSDLTHYRQFSADISKIAQEFSHSVERLGLDENFIDVSERVADFSGKCNKIPCHYYGDKNETSVPNSDYCGCGCYERLIIGSQIAQEIRKTILERTGITCCAGIAHNKLIAKLVSGYHKPNDQTVIFPWQVQNLMSSLKSVKGIPGIGSVTSKNLSDLCVFSVGDLQNISVKLLNSKFNSETSKRLKDLSFGIDEGPVQGSMRPLSIGLEDAFKEVSSFDEVKVKYQTLLDRLLKLLANDGRQPSSLKVSARKFDLSKRYGHRETRQVPVSPSFFSRGVADVSENAKVDLLNLITNSFLKLVDIKKPFHLTMIGLGFTKFITQGADTKLISNFFQKKRSHIECEERDTEKREAGKGTYFSANLEKKPKLELSDLKSSSKEDIPGNDSEQNTSGNIYVNSTSLSECEKVSSFKKCITHVDSYKELEISGASAHPLHPRGELSSGGSICIPSEWSSGGSICIPSEIDKDVFIALPVAIQKEILQSFKGSQDMSSYFSVPSFSGKKLNCEKASDLSDITTIKKYLLPLKSHSQSLEISNEKQDLQSAKVSLENENQPSCSSAVYSGNKAPSLNLSEKNINTSDTVHGSELPEEVDINVFKELPGEIQAEILKESVKHRKSMNKISGKSSFDKKQRGSSILKYLKKI